MERGGASERNPKSVSNLNDPRSGRRQQAVLPRAAEKFGRKYVKDFAHTMRRELGMKVLVVTSHVDTKGTVSYAALVLIHSSHFSATYRTTVMSLGKMRTDKPSPRLIRIGKQKKVS